MAEETSRAKELTVGVVFARLEELRSLLRLTTFLSRLRPASAAPPSAPAGPDAAVSAGKPVG